MTLRYEATHLRGNRYAIRPVGALGTCGWIKGKAWTVAYINARSPAKALLKFHVSYSDKEPIVEQRAVADYVSEGLGENIDFCPSDNT